MIPYSDIAALAFTGRDTAAGKSWEAWVKKYVEKKAAGEKAHRAGARSPGVIVIGELCGSDTLVRSL